MKNWLREFLGINRILSIQESHERFLTHIIRRHNELADVHNQVIITNRGMARLIAKLDPTYAKDELDPVRRDASDKIGNEVLKRLLSEHIASNPNG